MSAGSTRRTMIMSDESKMQPVYFVLSESAGRWPDLVEREGPPLAAEDLAERFSNATDCWVVQTYVHLRQAGLPVRLVRDYVPGEICVTSADEYRLRRMPFRSFLVLCRHDRGLQPQAHLTICQNPATEGASEVFVPHWPQPGLIPRAPERGTRIQRLAYKGVLWNLDPQLRSESFAAALKDLGVELALDVVESYGATKAWRDYSACDLSLAARNLTVYDATVKPFSKLVNAWAAGCPALLGPEPAFRLLRQDDLDYIEIRRPEDVLTAVDRLQKCPDIYSQMIERGRRRFLEFDSRAVTRAWIAALSGPIARAFQTWRARGASTRWITGAARFAWRYQSHKREATLHRQRSTSGPRIFETMPALPTNERLPSPAPPSPIPAPG